MKFITANQEGFTFRLSSGEIRLLGDLLRLYPLTPESIHRITRNSEAKELAHSQQLLEESLTEHRQTVSSWLSAWVHQNLGVDLTLTESTLQLKGPDLELLLQVFNDIRVGSWMLLGSPTTEQRENLESTQQTHALLCVMDMCAAFQISLMQALNPPPGASETPSGPS